ncbi:MAG: insulinase family protein, partial [Opitutaceae bacterium]|nr:insulinase family protein [Opitutaceae bacterium]
MRKTAKTQARGAGRTAGLPEGFWAKKAARRELANGVTALALRDDTAPLASVQVWVKTGSIHEGARAGSGVSHFLEHMVFKGTGRRTAAAISREAQALGGLMNAYTSFDRTVYHMDLPSEHWAAALDLLADMTLRPALPEAEVARERDVILREIDMCRDDAEQRLWERLFGAVFREHPFRIPIIGHREVFARLGREDLVAYHRERYAPENLVVVVAGDVEEEAALAEIGRLFGAEERRGPAPAFVPAEPAQAGAREACFYEDVELTRGALAWPVGGFADADAPALSALALLLGGGDSSLLWRELRERRRLVHTIDASCWNPGTPGVFCVTFTCDADKRAEVEREVARQLAGVARRGFSKKEIAKAARQLVAGEVASRKTVAGQASRIGGAELASGDPNFSEVWFKRVARVGNAELKRVAGKWLGEGTRTAVSLNPKGAEPAAAPAVVARRGGEVAVETLENGARLVLRRNDRLPTAHFRLLAGGGARAEAAGARGSAALLATLLTRDTERRTAAEVAADIEGAGGSFFPFSGNNSLGLGVEVLRGDEGLALEILEDAALRPAFTRRGFDTEREAQLAELRQDADDVTAVGRKLLREKFFGAHPLAVEPTGREADLRRLSAGEIRALWRRLVVSGNAVLSVCGDFGGEKTVGRLRRFLGRLPEGKAAESAGARGRG